MEFADILQKRRTIRLFQQKKVEKNEKIRKLENYFSRLLLLFFIRKPRHFFVAHIASLHVSLISSKGRQRRPRIVCCFGYADFSL